MHERGIWAASSNDPPIFQDVLLSLLQHLPRPTVTQRHKFHFLLALKEGTNLVKCQGRVETQTPRPLGRDSCNLPSWPVSDVGVCLGVGCSHSQVPHASPPHSQSKVQP